MTLIIVKVADNFIRNFIIDLQNPEMESARPSTLGEEELQLQLALAMSKEEADEEKRKERDDDVRLQMALEESRRQRESDEVGGASCQFWGAWDIV